MYSLCESWLKKKLTLDSIQIISTKKYYNIYRHLHYAFQIVDNTSLIKTPVHLYNDVDLYIRRLYNINYFSLVFRLLDVLQKYFKCMVHYIIYSKYTVYNHELMVIKALKIFLNIVWQKI
jgi:hypothetical protein